MKKNSIINPYTFEEEPWIMKRYQKIASFIKGNKVLDIGCGNGRLKKVIKSDIELHGIDIDEQRINICKKLGYTSVQCFNIDKQDTLPFPDKYFSTVACLDILEHLYDPIKVLSNINKVLDNKGHIIISCPNIGFFLFRILMLLGIFSDIEIPQRIVGSHIRFFTIRRLKNILHLCGFKTKFVYGTTPTPWPKIIAGPINFLARIYPPFFAYNFILIAEKIKSSSKNSEDSLLVKDRSVLKQLKAVIKWG
jgi:2-polyprenyl-3-methyl-5-hydroxy-6-metoxy-1,4-benzoquinol methylase